jgi:cyclic-di-GMP-binding protein
MPSFDIVSKVALHEVDNAVQNAHKEVTTRYDFRDTQSEIELTDEGIVLRSSSEARLEAARVVLYEKLVKRNVSLKSLDTQDPEPGSKGSFKQLVKLTQGVAVEKARDIVKHIKDAKLKVQAAIQGDQLRVSGKKKDDLQSAIQALRAHDFGLPLQFTNFRD